jgi:hypothetical protein
VVKFFVVAAVVVVVVVVVVVDMSTDASFLTIVSTLRPVDTNVGDVTTFGKLESVVAGSVLMRLRILSSFCFRMALLNWNQCLKNFFFFVAGSEA